MNWRTPCNWTIPCAYNPEQKATFHRAARERLEALAAAMDWKADTYDLRSNRAGIAVSGEITLHHDTVYIQVSQSGRGMETGILIRTCQGRSDCTGGRNAFESLDLVEDIPVFCRRVGAVLHRSL
jgi:hypothetical protein